MPALKNKKPELKAGDRFTISGFGQNKSGDMIRRTKSDNKEPPFWGLNLRTRKRGRAVKLMVFRAQKNQQIEA